MAKSVSDGRLLGSDPQSGLVETFFYDPDTDGFTIETSQDVTHFLDTATALRNDAPIRWGEWAHVARIPSVILMELAKQGIVTATGNILDEPRFRAWLNDRDNQFFRTRPGKV